MTRVSSMDVGYQAGDLSVFPLAADTPDTLYQVSNNAATTLAQTLPINGTYLIVNDASTFPSTGLIRLGPNGAIIPSNSSSSSLLVEDLPGSPGDAELIYYGQIINNTFSLLQRGFAGSRQNQWNTGTPVTNSVEAETHNTLKDAIINVEKYLGTVLNPSAGTINNTLDTLEIKYFTPSASFKAYPVSGRPQLTVNFQNFCSFNVEKFLWDFGDGTTATGPNPTHTYNNEGYYTVTLNVITNTNAQGITTKNNYISVINTNTPVFFYTQPNPDDKYSFAFVDQTEGDVVERLWVFGDGSTHTEPDPNSHVYTHSYLASCTGSGPWSFTPNLLVTFGNQTTQRGYLSTTVNISA